MSRRRRRSAAQMPDCLVRFDWREWRPPAPADHPDPSYVEWYLAVGDWQAAQAAWLAGEPVLLPPERPLPDPIPYTGILTPVGGEPRTAHTDVPTEHKARHIDTYYRRRRT
ncbi:hypothetical protein [Streptomyces chartreusis]|uniref:Uncharacterized protein n=1 Tax=Streptomyces chartreusis TaxID=1969 RepID=A0A7H8TFA0_STRCX|nr:hypothetical protein [Streptomyces chartreusis]QKZ22074.1 hypothetical protein HUT05_34830 [Streptomyces chartreusis]